MSIGKRIEEAIAKMDAGDCEGALIPASIAVDATATQEYPALTNNQVYKSFLGDNLDLFTRASFGGIRIGRIALKYDHPDSRSSADGTCTVEQILYHVVRCGLLHQAGLPPTLRFTSSCLSLGGWLLRSNPHF